MARSRRYSFRIGMGLAAATLAVGGLALGLCGLRVSRAEVEDPAAPSGAEARQVTVFAILATPGSKGVDSKLARIQAQLNRLLPYHGFKLLDAQSRPLVAGESVVCDLGHGYTAKTSLVRPEDPDILGAIAGVLAAQVEGSLGKVQLRCELFRDRALQFSAHVKTPLNQLFFCEYPFLDDGSNSKLLIGIGAR